MGNNGSKVLEDIDRVDSVEDLADGAESEATPVAENISDVEFLKELKDWTDKAKGRSMRVMVCGLGGAGKSTLINNLLQLEDEERLKTGTTGKATTTTISQHKRKTKNGIKVRIFDTPGLDDSEPFSDDDIVAEMKSETKSKLDLVLYCISLSGGTRVQGGDIRAMKILTKSFTNKIWTRSVIVLTFANALEERVDQNGYEQVLTNIKERIQNVLKDEAGVDDEIVNDIPIVTAGHTDPVLKYEAENCKDGWVIRLFLAALKQVNPDTFPALYETRLSWKNLISTIGATTGGALMGAGIGAGTGALFGEVGGPFGAVIGAGVGAVVGGAIGGVSGGLKKVGYLPTEIKPIVKNKFTSWKKNRNTDHHYKKIPKT